MITRLRISDLRIIDNLDVRPGEALNLLVGGNGAGKTSILEGLYLAGRGMTFRHHRAGPLIRRGAEAASVIVDFEEVGKARRLGVRRSKTALACRLDGSDVKKRSVLAQAIPILWLSSQPQNLLDQGPDTRRRFIDMGLFHVEPAYLDLLNLYARHLRQRNAALRVGDSKGVIAWTEGYSASAESMDSMRQAYLAELMVKAENILDDWNATFSMQWDYRRGWAGDTEIREQLVEKFEIDLAQGFSGIGPHRADLVLTSSAAPVEKTLSRGQQKMLVFALNMALIDLMSERLRMKPIVLVDDLPAELDASNQAKIASGLRVRGIQSFIASITEPGWFDSQCDTMFHVEHGAATRTN